MNDNKKYCTVCKKEFKTPSKLLVHLNSKKHKNKQQEEERKNIFNETLPKLKQESDIYDFKVKTRKPQIDYEGFKIIESSSKYNKLYKTFIKEYKIISDKPTDEYENVLNQTIKIVKERTGFNPNKD